MLPWAPVSLEPHKREEKNMENYQILKGAGDEGKGGIRNFFSHQSSCP